jgi:hypothetical protein
MLYKGNLPKTSGAGCFLSVTSVAYLLKRGFSEDNYKLIESIYLPKKRFSE